MKYSQEDDESVYKYVNFLKNALEMLQKMKYSFLAQ